MRTDNIASQVEVFDWKDAIRKAGQILIDTGDIKEAYIEDMIESVNTLGPYMVIAKGFALAHAAPCEAVLHNAVSLINLKNGVDFGSRNDPVNVVMCLACTDRQSHMDKIQKIAVRLHRLIERYTLPGALRRQMGVRHPGKVFRDQDELPLSANLGRDIETALDNSAWLICEPICATLRQSRAPCLRMPLLRSVPRRYSITM